ncbi:oxygen-insensitive NADPH nitroreductase [Streptococcus pneumoniae]|nr:oxygen-insensitive NADPH nitroreductase [Streptococcus pneumoniae]
MTETIKLMKAHTSVRRFKEQEIPQVDLNEILTAAQMASSWKNFQSYSVIVVRSQEKKDALYELVPQEAIRQSAVFLLFVGDLNRAEKGAREQSTEAIQAYDRVQADYAGARATTSWSQRLAEQFGQAEPSSTRKNLEQKKLL